MKHNSTTTPAQKSFYRVPTLATMLDCSKGHIYNLLKAGELTRIKLSAQITVIDAAEADAWIEAHRTKTN